MHDAWVMSVATPKYSTLFCRQVFCIMLLGCVVGLLVALSVYTTTRTVCVLRGPGVPELGRCTRKISTTAVTLYNSRGRYQDTQIILTLPRYRKGNVPRGLPPARDQKVTCYSFRHCSATSRSSPRHMPFADRRKFERAPPLPIDT